ncbi:uncharacterized protein FMAN_10968 [Fusarium mangiferae]|uniref:Xylanolytic transcriptional activator regulatory domain-containing protein n=1 Tax=Fusarium mangiferae TaxID=192010 RepID=A0A1L7TD68_FUSMA|nr:uncharacterized protein FMAN_10968 [Fusarium mangiferae]CVK96638.1 uncharacterized protein FMAN_10968 [Fusarium mangiferae]
MATTSEPIAHPSAARTTVTEAQSHDFPPLNPQVGESSMTGLLDTEIMGVLDDALMSERNVGMDITRQSLSQLGTLETSAPMDQDHASFYFSPTLNFDMDHSAFAFLSLPDQSAIQDSGNQSYSQSHGNLRLQQLPIEEGGIYSTADNPLSETQPLAGVGALGQFMDDRSTPKSQASSNGLPALHEDRQIYTPAALDESAYQSILNDLSIRLTKTVESIQLPPARVCQSFLSSYTTNFHCHLPLIHLQSFSPRATPSPLILAMCSVGALYRLDRRRANRLHELAVSAIETVACPTRDSESIMVKNTDLWHAQTKLLLSFYAIMSGDKDLLSGTLRLNGYYVLLYKRTRTALASSSVDVSRLTWHQWIERESWKRLLGGLFFTSALTMVLFDVNPGFNATQDLEFEAFHDEAMWDASSANEWRQVRLASIKKHPAQHHRTMKEVLVDVMLEGRYHSDTAPYQVSAFSALILMHGVVVHMWQRLQVTHAIWSLDGPDLLGSSLMDSSMAILSRCDAFLKRAGSVTQSLDSDEHDETSLVFNCQAVLRIAYVSLFRTVNSSAHISLMSTDAAEMDDAIVSFVAGELDRSPQILNAVVKCFEGLRIPVKMGTMLVRKTAAFRWSVEHAISGWESALVVTKWVHAVEMMSSNGVQLGPEEQKLLTLVREVLEEAECELEQSSSLAAGVARTWGSFLQDVWIWGITPQMGATLGLLANAYEKAFNANRRSSVTVPNHLW